MLFSTRAEYGVRLMVELGRQENGAPVALSAVAESERTALTTLAKEADPAQIAAALRGTEVLSETYLADLVPAMVSRALGRDLPLRSVLEVKREVELRGRVSGVEVLELDRARRLAVAAGRARPQLFGLDQLGEQIVLGVSAAILVEEGRRPEAAVQ